MDQAAISDIIIVGAGAAGCVIASRLAAADATLRVLVLESGPDTLNDPAVQMLSRFPENFDPNSPRARAVTAAPNKHLLQRQASQTVGHCVGGGTAINLFTYTRPAASDFNCWERNHGNSGWGYADMLPMFKKLETFGPLKDAPTHGYDGPIRVSQGTTLPITEQWLRITQAYDKNITQREDVNDFTSVNAISLLSKWASNGSNVTLLTGCRVERVIFEGDAATGVEYRKQGASASIIAKAKKFVVLSAGALGSSLLLERSGIGSPTVLGSAGVQVRVALDGVGENFVDHLSLFSVFARDPSVREGSEALDPSNSEVDFNTVAQAGARVRPRSREEARAQGLNDAFIDKWSFFEDDKPVFVSLFSSGNIFMRLPPEEYFTTVSFSAYPFGRGSIHIRSIDAEDSGEFNNGYLSHPADISVLMWQYKWTRECARRMPSYRGEVAGMHPEFAADGEAACSMSRNGPVAIDAPDIVYSSADDEVLEAWIRRAVQSTWHPLGTCAMKPRDRGGVVDSRLNVYGVRGLKVADMSVAPENVSCNTASVAMAIGEKAAVIIAEDLGLAL